RHRDCDIHGSAGCRREHRRCRPSRKLCRRHRRDETRYGNGFAAGTPGSDRKIAPRDPVSLRTVDSEKILSRQQLKRSVEKWRKAGEKVTLANGCFDVLHVGHVRYLHAAKELGGRLIVAINSDESVRALKGSGRPLMPAEERAEVISALADVDAVVIFEEPDVRALVREIRPDVQAKGTDYTAENVPERDTVVECGGR